MKGIVLAGGSGRASIQSQREFQSNSSQYMINQWFTIPSLH